MRINIVLYVIAGLLLSVLTGCAKSTPDQASGANSASQSSIAHAAPAPKRGVGATEACAYFSNIELVDKKGYQIGPDGKSYSCLAMKNLGPSGEMNVLTYYAGGDATTVDYFSFSLELEHAGQRDPAPFNKLLALMTDDLTKKALGKPLTDEIKGAIMAETPGEWQMDQATIKLKREAAPVGKGYKMNLVLML